MKSIEEDSCSWEKRRLRKYDRQVEQEFIGIRREPRATESYFFGAKVVRANYSLYPHLKPPTLYFITKTYRR